MDVREGEKALGFTERRMTFCEALAFSRELHLIRSENWRIKHTAIKEAKFCPAIRAQGITTFIFYSLKDRIYGIETICPWRAKGYVGPPLFAHHQPLLMWSNVIRLLFNAGGESHHFHNQKSDGSCYYCCCCCYRVPVLAWDLPCWLQRRIWISFYLM